MLRQILTSAATLFAVSLLNAIAFSSPVLANEDQIDHPICKTALFGDCWKVLRKQLIEMIAADASTYEIVNGRAYVYDASGNVISSFRTSVETEGKDIVITDGGLSLTLRAH